MTLMRGMTVEGPGTLKVFNNIRRTTGEAGTSNIENGDGGDGGEDANSGNSGESGDKGIALSGTAHHHLSLKLHDVRMMAYSRAQNKSRRPVRLSGFFLIFTEFLP